MEKRQPKKDLPSEKNTANPGKRRQEKPKRAAKKQAVRTPKSRDAAEGNAAKPQRADHPFKVFVEKHAKPAPKKPKTDDNPSSERPDEKPRKFQVRNRPPQKFNAKSAFNPKPTAPAPIKLDEPMRLNKYIAHCGISARRQAAEFVKNGLVKVNGAVETNPGYLVQPSDNVEFKGQPVKLEERKVYILMNKPKNVITTSDDEKGRKTVLEIVGKKVPERIFPVGRLDRMTTGLLLLTNDGDLAKKLSHPSHRVAKFYQATLDKPLRKDDLERIRKGIELEDGAAIVDGIDYIGGVKSEIGIELHLGKNRIIRRIFEHLGYEITRLDRTYYAGLTKKDIGRGHFRHLTEREVLMLKHFK